MANIPSSMNMSASRQNMNRMRTIRFSLFATILVIFLLCKQSVGFRCLTSSRYSSSSNCCRRMSPLYIALNNVARTTRSKDPASSNSAFAEIDLPYLSPRDKIKLAAGERVQKQNREGRVGEGLVVIDVRADPDVVFNTLTQFSSYADMIPTIRTSNVIVGDDTNAITEFTLSRLKLRVNVLHRVYRDQRIVTFNLNGDRPNPVFKEANGYWHVQVPTDRPEGWCRVYLSASILVNLLVPPLIMDYAASRALPRASTWIKPHFSKATVI